MLKAEKLDAVDICLPTYLHAGYTIQAALAGLGPTPSDRELAGAIAGVLSRPAEDSLVQDLTLSVAAPVRERWALEQASAHAGRLLAAARLPVPEGRAGERFRAAVPAALLELAAPTYFAPRPAGPGGTQLGLVVTGMPVMHRGLSTSVMNNQLRSFFFAGLVVLLIMSILFRSLWSGLLGMVPASLTTLVIYGSMGLLGLRLDIGTSMLGAIIIGAGVDYAIHLVAAWRTPRGGDARESAYRAADRSGLGIWTNAVMVAAGFFILTLGDSRPLETVGALTAAAMLVALLGAAGVVVRARVFPVGRLDYHSAGLLVLTNDGALALRLTHPRYGVRKRYRVITEGRLDAARLSPLTRGVWQGGERLRAARVRLVSTSNTRSPARAAANAAPMPPLPAPTTIRS
jgi:membrane-bound metal-dependent hydrolase YbcI (DUF457 family)